MKKLLLLLLLHAGSICLLTKPLAAQHKATFDDLLLQPNSYWNGSSGAGGFQNNAFYFLNSFTDYGGGNYAWIGFAYSNQTDTLTTGLDNQFSCIAGTGANSSSNYAVTYMLSDWMTGAPLPNIIIFDTTLKINGCYISNNAYAYWSMKNGDAFSKKFGGNSGNDPDWFKISAWGYYQGITTDTIDFYLADYRFSNNQQDYIIKQWTWWDMDTLGIIDSLKYILSSTDANAYGLRTPAYFCIDDFSASTTVHIAEKNSHTLSIYPNPATDYFCISGMDNSYETMQIIDISGKLMHEQKINSLHDVIINSSFLPRGWYFISLTGKNSKQILKFQKI